MSNGSGWRRPGAGSRRPVSWSDRSRARAASARPRRCGAASCVRSGWLRPSIAGAPRAARPDIEGGVSVEIAVLLYDRFTALDAVGPYEVLSRVPGARVTFVADESGPVRTDNGMLTVIADRPLAEVPAPDIVLVPGGPG